MQTSLTEPIHTTTYRVVYADTDAGAFVYNASYLRLFEIGRTEFMRDWAVSYREIAAMGLLLPVTECYMRFKAPAFYDDLLTIETSLTELSKMTCRFCYKISRQEADAKRPKLLVKGQTVHAAINNDGKLSALPEEVRERLHRLV